MSNRPGSVTIAKRFSPIRPVSQPLAWIGSDRLLADDVTIFGLRRLVVARKDDPPNVTDYLMQMQDAEVYAWCVLKDDGFWYLWMVWKEPT